ncbi:Bax inhibitor-1/YccA family protein [Streptomyces sp. NPDC006743]|uniref:Bax inhibitor-1/YccA family membrane protein n=1 Tax=Streptomyces sp. NPDC006743 TaxID=3154480 RepID=UPI0034573141
MAGVEQRSLKSSNPLLSRRRLERRGGRKTAAGDRGTQVEVEAGLAVARERTGTGQDTEAGSSPEPGPEPSPWLVADLLTMDAVVARAALTLATATLTAVLAWTVPPVAPAGTGWAYGLAGAAALLVLVPVLVQYARTRPSAGLALVHAVGQGAFLGVLSDTICARVAPGACAQLVLGTMTGCAGVLAAHRLRWTRIGRRGRGLAGAGALGLVLLAAADLLLPALSGAEGLGLRSGVPGVVAGVVGVVLGTSFLALHLRRVQHALTRGVPAQEAWLAAFGLTLTLVWLYVETVRLLTLVPQDDLY